MPPRPFFKENVDWKLEDPKGKSIDKVREIRDEIELRVQELIAVEKKFYKKGKDPVFKPKLIWFG